MDILIVSTVLFSSLILIKECIDMCKARAEIDMIYRMCKFFTICYLEDNPETEEFFKEMMQKDEL